MNPKVNILLYSLFIFLVFILAYIGFIPTELKAIPHYDSIGHLVLYGIWGYLSAKVFKKPLIRLNQFSIPTGILIVTCIAIIEETFQSLSPIRTFSLYDMGWGILGIAIACVLINLRK